MTIQDSNSLPSLKSGTAALKLFMRLHPLWDLNFKSFSSNCFSTMCVVFFTYSFIEKEKKAIAALIGASQMRLIIPKLDSVSIQFIVILR